MHRSYINPQVVALCGICLYRKEIERHELSNSKFMLIYVCNQNEFIFNFKRSCYRMAQSVPFPTLADNFLFLKTNQAW